MKKSCHLHVETKNISGMDLNHPHDVFIRDFLSEKENAVHFLRLFLPDEVKGIIEFDGLRQIPGTFIDESLKEFHSDISLDIICYFIHNENCPGARCGNKTGGFI